MLVKGALLVIVLVLLKRLRIYSIKYVQSVFVLCCQCDYTVSTYWIHVTYLPIFFYFTNPWVVVWLANYQQTHLLKSTCTTTQHRETRMNIYWDVLHVAYTYHILMTPSNGNIFRVTGHLCGEFTGPRWIPRTKASDAELWCFLSSASE